MPTLKAVLLTLGFTLLHTVFSYVLLSCISMRFETPPAPGQLRIGGSVWPVVCAFYTSPLFGIGYYLLFRRWTSGPRFPYGRCQKCGYDIFHHKPSKCPECGAPTYLVP